MTITQLRREVRDLELGLVVEVHKDDGAVRIEDYLGRMVLIISNRALYGINTRFAAFFNLSDWERKLLLESVFKFSGTPIKDRKAGYRVKIEALPEFQEYVNIDRSTNSLRVSDDFENEDVKNEFTKEEAERILERFTDSIKIVEAE